MKHQISTFCKLWHEFPIPTLNRNKNKTFLCLYCTVYHDRYGNERLNKQLPPILLRDNFVVRQLKLTAFSITVVHLQSTGYLEIFSDGTDLVLFQIFACVSLKLWRWQYPRLKLHEADIETSVNFMSHFCSKDVTFLSHSKCHK